MILDEKTDALNTCQCGHKPTHYSIGYSRAPLWVDCKCGKNTQRYREIGGPAENVIEFWNEIAPLIEIKRKGSFTHEVAGKKLRGKEIRRYLLDEFTGYTTFDSIPLFILFKNGKIKCDDNRKFFIKGLDY